MVWNKVYDLRIKVRNEGEIGEYEFASDDNGTKFNCMGLVQFYNFESDGGTVMGNPWKDIDLADYENHMSLKNAKRDMMHWVTFSNLFALIY